MSLRFETSSFVDKRVDAMAGNLAHLISVVQSHQEWLERLDGITDPTAYEISEREAVVGFLATSQEACDQALQRLTEYKKFADEFREWTS